MKSSVGMEERVIVLVIVRVRRAMTMGWRASPRAPQRDGTIRPAGCGAWSAPLPCAHEHDSRRLSFPLPTLLSAGVTHRHSRAPVGALDLDALDQLRRQRP